jgi:hypothetical protein
MRISDREPVPPRCLGTMVARVPEEPLRSALMTAFVSEEEMARDREQHERLGRAMATYVATHDELSAWTLACTCGSEAGKLLGVRTADVYASPVCFACGGCGKTVDIFDATVDGWDGEIARKQRRRKARPASTFALRCPGCKGTSWSPAAVFTYQGEPDNFAKVPPERWQDFFLAIAVGGTCTRCEAVTLPGRFESA